MPEHFVNIVLSDFASDRGVEAYGTDPAQDSIAQFGAVERAAVLLLDLVAIVRIDQVQREVREQVERVRAHVCERAQLALVVGPEAILRIDLVPHGVAAFAWIDRAES